MPDNYLATPPFFSLLQNQLHHHAIINHGKNRRQAPFSTKDVTNLKDFYKASIVAVLKAASKTKEKQEEFGGKNQTIAPAKHFVRQSSLYTFASRLPRTHQVTHRLHSLRKTRSFSQRS